MPCPPSKKDKLSKSSKVFVGIRAEDIVPSENSTDLEKKASELDIAPNNIPDYDKLLKSLDFLRRKKDEIISNLKKYI
jgi:hypothetical protein